MIAAFLLGLICGVMLVAWLTGHMCDKWKREAVEDFQRETAIRVYFPGCEYPAIVMTLQDVRAIDRIRGGKGDLIIQVGSPF